MVSDDSHCNLSIDVIDDINNRCIAVIDLLSKIKKIIAQEGGMEGVKESNRRRNRNDDERRRESAVRERDRFD